MHYVLLSLLNDSFSLSMSGILWKFCNFGLGKITSKHILWKRIFLSCWHFSLFRHSVLLCAICSTLYWGSEAGLLMAGKNMSSWVLPWQQQVHLRLYWVLGLANASKRSPDSYDNALKWYSPRLSDCRFVCKESMCVAGGAGRPSEKSSLRAQPFTDAYRLSASFLRRLYCVYSVGVINSISSHIGRGFFRVETVSSDFTVRRFAFCSRFKRLYSSIPLIISFFG